MKQLSQEQISALPEWLPIPDFPSYEVNCRAGLVRNERTMKVLKPNLNNRELYPRVVLTKDGIRYYKNIHRIVANAAFGYYNISTDGLLVMHLDEERNDPRISNLAIGTTKENLNFPKYKQRISEATAKKVVGAYKNGELIMVFQSIKEAARNGFNQGDISSCCTGRVRIHKGYQWRFLD